MMGNIFGSSTPAQQQSAAPSAHRTYSFVKRQRAKKPKYGLPGKSVKLESPLHAALTITNPCCRQNHVEKFALADVRALRSRYLQCASENKCTEMLVSIIQSLITPDMAVRWSLLGLPLCRHGFARIFGVSLDKLDNCVKIAKAVKPTFTATLCLFDQRLSRIMFMVGLLNTCDSIAISFLLLSVMFTFCRSICAGKICTASCCQTGNTVQTTVYIQRHHSQLFSPHARLISKTCSARAKALFLVAVSALPCARSEPAPSQRRDRHCWRQWQHARHFTAQNEPLSMPN